MVEIMAIIRPNRVAATKQALIDVGYPGFTCVHVKGHGRKSIDMLANGGGLMSQLVTKRAFIMIVPDEKKDCIVQTIITVNSFGNSGDGKIFVSHVNTSYSIREGALREETIGN